MEKKPFLGMTFILLIIISSIDQPLINWDKEQQRIRRNPIPEDYYCVEKYLPDGVTALYFSQNDGSLTMEEKFSGEYFLLQYQLAPRLLAVYRNQPGDFSKYSWFIALRFDENQLTHLAAIHGFTLISRCGDYSVLQRHK